MAKYKIKNEAAGNIYVQYNGKQTLLMAGITIEAEEELIGEGTRQLEKDGFVSITSMEDNNPLPKVPDAEELKDVRAKEREQKDIEEAAGKALLEKENTIEDTKSAENDNEPKPTEEEAKGGSNKEVSGEKAKDEAKIVEEVRPEKQKEKKKKKGANQ